MRGDRGSIKFKNNRDHKDNVTEELTRETEIRTGDSISPILSDTTSLPI